MSITKEEVLEHLFGNLIIFSHKGVEYVLAKEIIQKLKGSGYCLIPLASFDALIVSGEPFIRADLIKISIIQEE